MSWKDLERAQVLMKQSHISKQGKQLLFIHILRKYLQEGQGEEDDMCVATLFEEYVEKEDEEVVKVNKKRKRGHHVVNLLRHFNLER